MPLLDLQQQFAEIGRIRVGASTKNAKGRKEPYGLNTFLITTAYPKVAAHIADTYGGKPAPWSEDPNLIAVQTEAQQLLVTAPPAHGVITQDYEMRDGKTGRAVRRCDSVINRLTGQACQCPAIVDERERLSREGRACAPVSRVNIMLVDAPALGVFRVETKSWLGARQLAGTAEMMQRVRDQTNGLVFITALLTIVRVGGPSSKSRTFALVPEGSTREHVTGEIVNRKIAEQLPAPVRLALESGSNSATPTSPPVVAAPPARARRVTGEPARPEPPPDDIEDAVVVEDDDDSTETRALEAARKVHAATSQQQIRAAMLTALAGGVTRDDQVNLDGQTWVLGELANVRWQQLAASPGGGAR